MTQRLKEPSEAIYRGLQRLDINPHLGKVWGPRGGERGKPTRDGYCRIDIWDGSKQCAVRVMRSHIVWWKHNGSWPKTKLMRRDQDKINDQISNLVPEPEHV